MKGVSRPSEVQTSQAMAVSTPTTISTRARARGVMVHRRSPSCRQARPARGPLGEAFLRRYGVVTLK